MRVLRSMVGCIGVALTAAASLSLAGPVITMEKTEFDVGTVREGQLSVAEYSFKFKNTGDAELKITRVNPG